MIHTLLKIFDTLNSMSRQRLASGFVCFVTARDSFARLCTPRFLLWRCVHVLFIIAVSFCEVNV